MLRLTSPKTYQVLESILEEKSFSQTGLNKKTLISIGRINKIVNWLIEKGIVIKDKKRYLLIKPNFLIETISLHLSIKKKMFYQVALSKDQAKKLLKNAGAVFCLNTALEKYDKEKTDNEVHLYYDDNLIEELNRFKRGEFKINLYESNIDHGLTSQKNQKSQNNFTSEIRTIIDLNSIGNQKDTQDIAKKLFGTMQ